MIPPKPRTLWRDIKKFFARRERHNLIALVFAIAIPAGIIYLLAFGSQANLFDDGPVVIYAESWPLDRSNEQIIDRQRVIALAEDERRATNRESFQRLADRMGVDYDREAAAENARISAENQRRLAEPVTDGPVAEDDAGGR